MSESIAALILAAGESSRMREGSDMVVLKPLLPYRGNTVLGHLVETIQSAGIPQVGVVLGYQAENILPSLYRYSLPVIINRSYPLGMLSSIQCGLKHLSTHLDPPPKAYLICLGDQPGLQTETFKELLATTPINHDSIRIASFENRKGHPILIPAGYVEEILSIPPEKGLRELMQRHPDKVTLIPLRDSWITRDMDTPDDYRKALEEI